MLAVFDTARHCLALAEPAAKCSAVTALAQAVERDEVAWGPAPGAAPPPAPGRPERPELVNPARVPRRRLGSAEGLAALVHAIAHIEFNAINLALDAVCRFGDMPRNYYRDWISVAADEARHFGMLQNRLQQMGRAYGDFPAHGGLWEMAEKTAGNCLVRMALVPRVLEARGLDVTPAMMARLEQAGDRRTAGLLAIILAEEVRHVAIGTRWFRHCCSARKLEPERTFLELVQRHSPGILRGPFNLEARRAAGFSRSEICALSEFASA